MTTTALGPIDYLVVEFPGARFRGEILAELSELTNNQLIRILDLVVILRTEDDEVVVLEIAELDDELRVAVDVLDLAMPGLLTDSDIGAVAETIAPGSAAGLLIWENRWAAPLTAAVTRAGGEVVTGGRVDLDSLYQSLVAAGEITATNQGVSS